MSGDTVTKLVLDRAGDEPVCLFAYDLDALTEHVRRVVASLPERCRMFYAMKANSAAPVLRALAPVVAGFDAASGGEVDKVRAVAPDAVIALGGPAKSPQAISGALAQGVTRFHAESELDLARISEAARRSGRTAEVLLRVNLEGPFPTATLAMAGRPTQFGISEAGLPAAVALARELPAIRLTGFHLHSLSNNLSAQAHLDLLDLYRRKVTGWEHEFGLSCEVLNVGGGVGVNYADLDAQFDWPGFADGLAALVESFPAHWREIAFECGRYLTAFCGYYAAEVLDVKTNHGEHYAILRGGTHHFRLPSSWQHNHPFTVVEVDGWPLPHARPEHAGRPVTVTGELCTPKDVLARNVPVERVRAGDVLLFSHAGAYGWDISHHDFLSHPHPERVFVSAGGELADP
ncbi:type III PLP-dependent enzyme [Saccharopolyspora taberi]|uniref:Staphyloferrin B biosynthesis decarboxylase SbnH n=1 Tax=Saccharopolyspora taberi TaxID=60895 RepID=A0ABN3V2D0_9PSEU